MTIPKENQEVNHEQIILGVLRIGLELAAAAIDFDFQVLVAFDASCFKEDK